MKRLTKKGVFGLWKIVLTMIVLFFAAAAFTALASAATIYVPDNFSTIQQAVDNATAGDTIIVRNGTYNETVDVTKSHLTIRSEHGPSVTTVSASHYPNTHVFNIADQTNVTLEGFEIRDARGTSQSVAGIYMNNASECNISNNVVMDISATNWNDAYGIYLVSSSGNSFDTTTVYNIYSIFVTKGNDAYGIYLDSSSGNSFDTTTVYNLDAKKCAYGIYLDSSSGNSFVTTTVHHLHSPNYAYGIWLYTSSNNSFVTTTVSDIYTRNYGAYGIYLDSSSGNSFVTTTVYNLYSYLDLWCDASYGIYLYSSSGNSFVTTTVYNLYSQIGDAYGIRLYSSNDNSFDTSTVYNLGASEAYGIRLYSSSDNNSFVTTTVYNLDAGNYAYGIRLYSSSGNSFNTSAVYNLSAAYAYHAYGIYLDYSSGNNSFVTSTVYNLGASEAYGIRLYYSSGNSFVTTTVYNISSANSYAYGIHLGYSSGNSFDTSTVYNISARDYAYDAYGILLVSSSGNNSFDTSTVYNISSQFRDAYGIRLYYSSGNSFDTSTVYNISSANHYALGIYLYYSSGNSFVTSTVYNLDAGNDAYGIWLYYSSGNSFSSGSISGLNAPIWWDFYSDENAQGNSAEDITISSIATTISFTYENGIMLKSVATPPADPADKLNISKYVNVTNVTAGSWIFMNVSYEEGDLGGVVEDSLRLWQHNGTDWTEVPGTNGVNTAENYVYANITEFSVFAPLGYPPPVNCTCGDICVNTTGWWHDGGAFIASGMPIQDAIENATAGDTICVKNGTYNENVDVTKSHLTIRSEHGPSVTTVSASHYPNTHVFKISDQTNVTLEGFEIRDARGTSQSVAGIYMNNASECNISNNVVMNISATGWNEAYGIYLDSSSDNNSFVTSTVYNLYADWGAYGIYLSSSSGNSFVTSTVYKLSSASYTYGIYLGSSSDNSFDTTTVYNLGASEAYGIWLDSSSDNNSFVTTTVYNLDAYHGAYGIYLSSSSGNSFDTTTVYTISSVNYDAYGIYLHPSSGNSFVTTTVYHISAHTEAYGIYLSSSSGNSFVTTTVYNLSSTYYAYGIRLFSSNDNSFSSGSISDINALTWWDFYSDASSHGNSAENITISSIASFPTTISFTYENGIMLKSVATPPADPAYRQNISKYVTVTEVTAESWIFMNVSYEEGDLGGVIENSLRLWKHNGTDWTEVPGTNGVNTAENYVYANITEFSVFAPLGNVTGVNLGINKTGVPDPVPAGGTLNYSISVNNTGNATATNVTVTETYDENVTFVTAVPAPLPGNDTWQFATLNVSETRWINISVTVNASVLNGTVLHNVVNVTCDECVMDSDTEDTTVFVALNCTCGDICVNETGWWYNGGAFIVSNTPIQAAINNAIAGDTICVKNGTYNETVDVTKSHLTIRSENGPSVTTVSASHYPNTHVFDIADQTNVTLEGFEIRDARGTSQSVAGIYMNNASECNISNNIVTNISTTGWNEAFGIWLYSSSGNSFDTSTVYNLSSADGEAYGIRLISSSGNSFDTTTVYNLSSADNYAYGIRLYSSSGNSFVTTTVYNLSSAYDYAYGILLYSSSDNSFDTTTVYNLDANYNAYGIYLDSSSDNNSFVTTTVYNISSAYAYCGAYGIYLYSSSGNSFVTTTFYNLSSADGEAYGIRLISSSDNSFVTTTVYNLDANYNANGIWLEYSNDNSFSSGSISDLNAPIWWDFYSDENAHRNSAENITISSIATTISFTYDNGIMLKSVVTPLADPAYRQNISKYVNVTEVTANSWIFMNVSYEEGDLGGVAENSLRLWQHNGTDWTEVFGTNGVNTAKNYVYANITEFSVFAPLGNVTGAKLEINKTGVPDPVSPGGTLNYTIHVNNTGNATAANVTVKETYDGNVTFVSAVPASLPGNDTWKFTSLNVSETRWINISVTVNASVLNGTVLHNVVNVTCDEGVADSDTEETTVFVAPALPPDITSFAPPSPVNDTVCNWRTFNVSVNQTVNVSWYLNNTLQHTNESTKEASYSLHAEVVGEHNVSAIASNANGTDMQTWMWNISQPTGLPDLVIEDKWEDWVNETHYNVSYIIHNNGTAVAPACHNTTLYVDGVAIEHKHVPVDLAYCETYTDTFNTTIECSGEVDKIKVCADNYDAIDELDETNNCLANKWKCKEGKPDLVIADKWEKGKTDRYNVFFVVENIGTATAPQGHYVTLYVDGEEKENLLVQMDLKPGRLYSGIFRTKVKLTDDSDTIKVCADNENDVDEEDETNNCLENVWP